MYSNGRPSIKQYIIFANVLRWAGSGPDIRAGREYTATGRKFSGYLSENIDIFPQNKSRLIGIWFLWLPFHWYRFGIGLSFS